MRSKVDPQSWLIGILFSKLKHILILSLLTAFGDRQIDKQAIILKEKIHLILLNLIFNLFYKLLLDLADLEQKSVAIFPLMSYDCDEKWDYCLVGGTKPS